MPNEQVQGNRIDDHYFRVPHDYFHPAQNAGPNVTQKSQLCTDNQELVHSIHKRVTRFVLGRIDRQLNELEAMDSDLAKPYRAHSPQTTYSNGPGVKAQCNNKQDDVVAGMQMNGEPDRYGYQQATSGNRSERSTTARSYDAYRSKDRQTERRNARKESRSMSLQVKNHEAGQTPYTMGQPVYYSPHIPPPAMSNPQQVDLAAEAPQQSFLEYARPLNQRR